MFLIRIFRKFLFTVCQNFFCHCYAPSITLELTAEQITLTENMQGEYHMMIATPNERMNYSLPVYRRN